MFYYYNLLYELTRCPLHLFTSLYDAFIDFLQPLPFIYNPFTSDYLNSFCIYTRSTSYDVLHALPFYSLLYDAITTAVVLLLNICPILLLVAGSKIKPTLYIYKIVSLFFFNLQLRIFIKLFYLLVFFTNYYLIIFIIK